MSDIERKLASLRQISKIEPIPGADAIEVATVDGWKVVVKKDEFQEGDLAIYFEIDSWIPHEYAPFLSKGKEPREYNGIKGERLRTVKLRGQVSQGLLIRPINIPGLYGKFQKDEDLTELLNIQKWEREIPANLRGTIKGNFPSFLVKTDQERVQNLSRTIVSLCKEYAWEVTEKLDGSSMTVYVNRGEYGVCSRNLDLAEDATNSFWKVAHEAQLFEKMSTLAGMNFAIQGELVGEGIQGNPYNLKGLRFYAFDLYLIDEGRYATPNERRRMLEDCGIESVPTLSFYYNPWLTVMDIYGEEEGSQELMGYLLSASEGKSVLNEKIEREGLVFKASRSWENDLGRVSFKAISNKFLLKEKE